MDKISQYETLINRLRRTRYVSGTELAAELAVSRTVINRRLQELGSMGLRIHAVTGKGYHLDTQISLLNMELLQGDSVFRFHRHLITQSTNDDVLALARIAPQPALVATEYQTAGKGRRGKPWQSNFGQDLAFSIGFPLRSFEALRPFSLCAGLLLAETLSEYYCPDVRVKWPNDLLIGGAKLAGILTEIHTLADSPYVIIGMGLNVNRPDAGTVDQPATSLRQVTGDLVDRNLLLARLAATLGEAVGNEFTMDWHHRWPTYDALAGRSVRVHLGQTVNEGIAAGVAADGSFLLHTETGEQRYNGGEISVRAQ